MKFRFLAYYRDADNHIDLEVKITTTQFDYYTQSHSMSLILFHIKTTLLTKRGNFGIFTTKSLKKKTVSPEVTMILNFCSKMGTLTYYLQTILK